MKIPVDLGLMLRILETSRTRIVVKGVDLHVIQFGPFEGFIELR